MILLALPLLAAFPLCQDDALTDEERLAAGWGRQDLTWIPPDELEKVEQGLWKCGDEWLTLDEANTYHSKYNRFWQIPTERALLFTTLARVDAERAAGWVDQACADLERLFGVVPAELPLVVVLRSREQFLKFAGGQPEKGVPGKSFFLMQNLHGAYLADNWFDDDGMPRRAGVAFWTKEDDREASFGPLWIRHAAGQSYAEQLDFGPESMEKLAELREKQREVRFDWVQSFWEEKSLPSWLRFGASTYVERYYVDEGPDNNGDPLWTRKWSVDNIRSRGGFDGVEDVLEEKLRINDPEGFSKWMNETGLVVAFILDGEDAKVAKAHAKLKKAMVAFQKNPKKGRKGLEKALKGLGQVLEKQQKELEAFAGL